MEASVSFTTEYFNSVGNLRSKFIQDFENLDDYLFIVRFKSYEGRLKKAYPNINIMVEHDIDKAMDLVKEHDNYHFVSIHLTSDYIIQKYGFNNFKNTGVFDKADIFGSIGINKRHPQLIDVINKTLIELGDDTIKDIYKKYEIKEFTIVDYNKYFYYIFALIGVVFIILYIRYKVITKYAQEVVALKDTLKNASEIAHLGTWELDAINDVVTWTDITYDIFGVKKNSDVDLSVIESLIYKDDLQKHQNEVKRSIELLTSFNFEYRINKNNNIRLIHAIGNPIVRNNVVIKLVGVVQDITELKESETRLIEAQKIAKLGSWKLDILSNHLEWSDEIFEIFEIDKNKFDASYEGFLNVIHPDDRYEVNLAYTNSLVDKKAYEIIHRLLLSSGKLKWVIEKCETTFNEDGDPLFSIGTVQDITKEKERELELEKAEVALQEAYNRYDKALSATEDGIWDWNVTSGVVYYSPAWKSMLGYTDKEIKNEFSEWERLLHPDDFEYAKFEVLKLASGEAESYSFEFRMLCKDGSSKWILSRAKTVERDEHGKPRRIIGTHVDLQKQKEFEEQLKQAKDIADQANESKSEFLANMSHEIRTPLNGIIGLTDILLNMDLNEVQHDYLSKVKQSSHALMHIINDILDYSKIESGKLSIIPREFYLDNLVRGISDLFSYQISQKGLDFIFTIDPKIPIHLIGDTLRLTQVLNNLLGNALKFTEEGSIQLDIKILSTAENTVFLRFSVIDSGIGINDDNKVKIFNAFEQGDSSTTRQYGGTGLGLVISKQLVELMGGNITFQSKEGKGSIFSFDINFEYINEELEYDLTKLQKYRFLIVDDSDVDRNYLKTILQSWNVEIDTASDGKEALDKLKKFTFDYLLLDWYMPDMDGLALLDNLRINDINPKNILMITAYDKEKLLNEASEHGLSIQNTLLKPYTPSMLYNTLIGNDNESFYEINETLRFNIDEPKKALIVEDNQTNQLVAKNLIEDIGFEVELANNGKEGVDMCRDGSYDIIFMDLQMPVMDGYQASKSIRSFNSTIPIIALSAAVMQKDKALTKEAGMNNHLAKPIDKPELYKIIKEFFTTKLTNVTDNENIINDPLLNKITTFDINLAIKKIGIKKLENLFKIYVTYKHSFEKTTDHLQNMDVDSEDFKQYIHKLKGASSNLLLDDIVSCCEEIENKGASVDLLNQLNKSLKYVIRDITDYIVPLVSRSEHLIANVDEAQDVIKDLILKIENGKLITLDEFNGFLYSLTSFITENTESVLKDLFLENKEEDLVKQLTSISKDILT